MFRHCLPYGSMASRTCLLGHIRQFPVPERHLNAGRKSWITSYRISWVKKKKSEKRTTASGARLKMVRSSALTAPDYNTVPACTGFDGHTAAAFVSSRKPSKDEILEDLGRVHGRSGRKFGFRCLHRSESSSIISRKTIVRRQRIATQRGMAASVGCLREDNYVWTISSFCLSHNTLRGSRGGVLLAELLAQRHMD